MLGFEGKTGKRGRPRGTLDKRYAEYGGVWGFRREMRRRDRAERLQYMQNARAMSRGTFAGLGLRPPTPPNPNRARESATFPDTDGSVDMADFNNIVDEATSTYD